MINGSQSSNVLATYVQDKIIQTSINGRYCLLRWMELYVKWKLRNKTTVFWKKKEKIKYSECLVIVLLTETEELYNNLTVLIEQQDIGPYSE
jgi:hypothetical protein